MSATDTVSYIQPKGSDELRELQHECWLVSEEHGWHEIHDHTFVEKLCLIHSELSEALEEYRDGRGYTETYFQENGKPEGIPTELADAIIRILDLAEIYGMDLAQAIATKHAYNRTRPFRHGGKTI